MSSFTSSTSAVFMLVTVWTLILVNMLYCFFRLLTSKKQLGSADDHE
jgi:hypothetical protein